MICFTVSTWRRALPRTSNQMNPGAGAELKTPSDDVRPGQTPPRPILALVQSMRFLDLGKSVSPDRRPVRKRYGRPFPSPSAQRPVPGPDPSDRHPLGVCGGPPGQPVRQTDLRLRFIALPCHLLAGLAALIFFACTWLASHSGIRSLNYEYLPPGAALWDLLKHLILPVLLSAFGGLAGLSRYMRANMLEVIRQDYIMTARAKGLSERVVIYKHALRNALLPVITILGLSVPGLIGGSVIFETIFAIPGMGQLFYMSVMSRDYPTVMGILFIGAILTLAGNLIADVSYALADPRIRVS